MPDARCPGARRVNGPAAPVIVSSSLLGTGPGVHNPPVRSGFVATLLGTLAAACGGKVVSLDGDARDVEDGGVWGAPHGDGGARAEGNGGARADGAGGRAGMNEVRDAGAPPVAHHAGGATAVADATDSSFAGGAAGDSSPPDDLEERLRRACMDACIGCEPGSSVDCDRLCVFLSGALGPCPAGVGYFQCIAELSRQTNGCAAESVSARCPAINGVFQDCGVRFEF